MHIQGREMQASPTRQTAGLPPYAVMILVALLIRLAVIPFLYHEWLDPFVLEHWAFGRIGRSIVSGHGFGSPFADTGASALLPPVYPYVLAAIFKIFGIYTKASIIATLSLNSLLSSLTCVPVYLLARKSFGDRVAKWAGWGWAFSPYGIYYGADWAWSTCLVTLLLCWLFLIALELEESTRLRGWLGFGLLTGFTALTEPVVLSVVPFLGAWTCFRLWKQKRPWKMPGIVATLALLVVVAPWCIRNYETFHQFIPIRSGFGLEFYIGNNGYSLRWVNSNLHPNHNDTELAEYVSSGEIAYMAHKRQQAMDYVRSHPSWFVWMTSRRILYMWTGFWSLDPEYLNLEPFDPPNIFLCTTLTLLALAGLRRAFRANPNLAVRYAIVLVFFPLAYYLSHPETYYFRPVDPIIVVLAAYAVVGILDWRKSRRVRPPQIATSSGMGLTSNH
jgi:4-amino-4-deoxy-L-arabinose transferase-like glycosyltransferase